MRVFAETNRHLFSKAREFQGVAYQVIEVKSTTNPDKKYTIDLTHGRCSCPAWIYQKGGVRKPCKHLKAFGFKELMASEIVVAEPKKAKQVLVKEYEIGRSME